ncbi:VP80 [Parapoynx stagnalis nucleopolyhedrovirus]|uniref:VP80 n=1 Tax=Parapoynx stagnalis nucleopolyhedrovirus TaxID=2993413 RepID=A0A9E8C347_9ABAC|nr:VP80 [Parapoynx stagnalis nucleopolyhedrovirus]
MEQKNNSISIGVLTSKILTKNVTEIDEINASTDDFDEKLTKLYNLAVVSTSSEQLALEKSTENIQNPVRSQVAEINLEDLNFTINATRKHIKENNIQKAKYFFNKSKEYFNLIKNFDNNKKSYKDTLETLRLAIQNMTNNTDDDNYEKNLRQIEEKRNYTQSLIENIRMPTPKYTPPVSPSLPQEMPYQTPMPNYSFQRDPENFYEAEASTSKNDLDQSTYEIHQNFKEALNSEIYNNQVKTTFLKLIEIALTFLQNELYITTVENLKLFQQYLQSELDLNDIHISFNLYDCERLKQLAELAEKFINNFRCQPDSLPDLITAIRKNQNLIDISKEPESIGRAFFTIISNDLDYSQLPIITVTRSDYNNIKNKNVKLLLNLYDAHQAILFKEDRSSPINLTGYETDTAASGRSSRTRKRKTKESTPAAVEISSDEEEEFLDEFQKERKRQKLYDENFLRNRASEFSKTYINNNLKKLLAVTDSMKRLYDFCNCKNSLQTIPSTANYGSLIRKLNTYNMSFVEMNINFYELLFPLTLYDQYSSEVTFTIINYIFMASSYFQNCINNFVNMRNEFNKMAQLHQPDSIVMFVIKFNFICDMRNFVLQYLEDISANKQPNMKILNVLIMRDKIVKKEFSKLHVQSYAKSSFAKNSKYLDKLIKLMNADFNII